MCFAGEAPRYIMNPGLIINSVSSVSPTAQTSLTHGPFALLKLSLAGVGCDPLRSTLRFNYLCSVN